MQLSCIRGNAAEPYKVLAAALINPHQNEGEKMRKVISVAAILLALACPANAGDMPNGSPVPPPQPPAVATVEDDTLGTLQGGVMQAALDLLALLPSLF